MELIIGGLLALGCIGGVAVVVRGRRPPPPPPPRNRIDSALHGEPFSTERLIEEIEREFSVKGRQ